MLNMGGGLQRQKETKIISRIWLEEELEIFVFYFKKFRLLTWDFPVLSKFVFFKLHLTYIADECG